MTRTTTTRGVLWEVLAPVVRWPMYSPMRLGLVLVALVAALVVVGQLTSDPSPERPAAGPAAAREPASSPAGAVIPDGESSDSAESSSEPVAHGTERAASRLARRFVSSYVEPRGSHDVWLARLRRMATPELGQALETVDRANVTVLGRRVTDVEVRGVSATASAVVVKTDGSGFTVDLAHSGENWQVARLVPTDPTGREAA